MKTLALKSLMVMLAVAAGNGIAADADKTTEEENPHAWKSRVSSVAVFKNGMGFFIREGKVNLRDGWCVAGETPPAQFGTLAIYSHGKDEYVDVIGSGPGEVVEFDGTDVPNTTVAKQGRLEACRLLKLQVTYLFKDVEKTVAGKLLSVGPEYAVMENDGVSYAVPLAGLKKFQILERPVRVHVAGAEGRSPQSSILGMAYLRKGITWIPEYTLKVLDDTTAELTLRGTLVNEAEDLVHCDVNFVVGVPHFLHSDYLAPVSVGQVIRTIGAAVAPREVMSQVMNRAAIANDFRGDGIRGVMDRPIDATVRDMKEVTGNLPRMEGPGGADFTVYTKKDITLRRGEKAIVTLFVKKITYSHIYRWSPPDTLKHLIVLHNQTDTAWTTGPCLAVNQNNPLCEDLLQYVPKGGSGELPVTAAINIAHQQKETEIDRKLRAHEPSHQFYVDLVTLQGELKIRNYEKTTAKIMISATLPGKPTSASDGGSVNVSTDKLQLMERSGWVSWTLDLEAGKEKTLQYQYERFVPSR